MTIQRYIRAMPRRVTSRARAPFRIQLLVFPGATPIVPVGMFDLLRKSADLAHQTGLQNHIEVELVAASRSCVVRAAGELPVTCHRHLRNAARADLVVASPLDPEVLESTLQYTPVLDFVRGAFASGSQMASACTGAFVLAAAGLLDGRRATTHWAFQSLFSQKFPEVELDPQAILVRDGRLLTAGGATSFLNLVLTLVRQCYGAEVAKRAARMFLIDEKPPQGSYADFIHRRAHSDEDIARAQDLIERAGAGSLSVERLADQVAMSRRQFIRRFKNATGFTPIAYLQRARMDEAKRLLEDSKRSVAEIARKVGYEELAGFRRLFVRHAGLTPSEYRKRRMN